MNVGYKKAYGITLIALGSLNVILGLVLRDLILSLLPGAICLIVGTSLVRRPYFTLEETRIVVRALLGPLTRAYEIGSHANLVVQQDGKLYLKDGTKLPLSRSLADKDDWHKFVETISG